MLDLCRSHQADGAGLVRHPCVELGQVQRPTPEQPKGCHSHPVQLDVAYVSVKPARGVHEQDKASPAQFVRCVEFINACLRQPPCHRVPSRLPPHQVDKLERLTERPLQRAQGLAHLGKLVKASPPVGTVARREAIAILQVVARLAGRDPAHEVPNPDQVG